MCLCYILLQAIAFYEESENWTRDTHPPVHRPGQERNSPNKKKPHRSHSPTCSNYNFFIIAPRHRHRHQPLNHVLSIHDQSCNPFCRKVTKMAVPFKKSWCHSNLKALHLSSRCSRLARVPIYQAGVIDRKCHH